MRLRPLLTALVLCASADRLPAQQIVQLAARDVPLPADWTEVFRVGENEAREEEQFSRIAAAAFDADDNLFILDGQNNRIVVFDRTGRFVRTFARKGEGPGELRFPAGLVVTTDGHVVVQDRGNRALVVYRRDGTYVRNVPIDQSFGIGGRFMAAHPRGGVVFALNPGLRVRDGRPEIDTSGIRAFWLPSFAESARPTLLYSVPEPRNPEPPRVERNGGATMVMRQAPPAFTPQVHFGIASDGSLVFSHTADYALKIVGRPGQVTRQLQRPIRPRRVTEQDKQDEVRRRTEQLQSGGVRVMVGREGAAPSQGRLDEQELRQARENMIKNMQFGDTVPVIQGLFSDPAGSLWVWRSAAAAGQQRLIDIIGPDGRYVGTVQGHDLPLAVSRSGLAAYSATSDMDVPLVVVRRLPQIRG